MKKTIKLVSILLLLLFLSVSSVLFARNVGVMKAYPTDYILNVNNWRVNLSSSLVSIDGYIYLPLSEIGGIFNYTVSSDEVKKEINMDSIPQDVQNIFMPYETDLLGLHLGMFIEELTVALGEPIEKKAVFDGAFSKDVWYYYYRFGYVRLEPCSEGSGYYLVEITLDNDQFFSSRQLKVGMDYENILERYPVTMYSETKWQSKYKTQYLYDVSGSTYGVIVFNETKNIESINYYCSREDFDLDYSQFLNCYLIFSISDNKINSIRVGLINRD